ncbi:hypothetical protein ZEAMMB73_Zm00001d052656 [Zea mays]|uniref:Uncharacterized protein n=1 Tax=Zea mays TaxID=4577 RepID=A0A1D6QI98_MAIZE|nr:hypothetical protein ZEAMMB73_Zm00001d052656 [Zea mays]
MEGTRLLSPLLSAGEKAVSCGGGGASEIPELAVIRELNLRTIDELGLDKSIVSVFSPLSLNNNSWWMGSVGGVVAALSRKRSVDVRRINPKVPKEEAVTISGRLVQILSDHGPLTIGNTWNNTKGTENGITFFVVYEFRYPINQSVKQSGKSRGAMQASEQQQRRIYGAQYVTSTFPTCRQNSRSSSTRSASSSPPNSFMVLVIIPNILPFLWWVMSSANDALACPIRLWHRNPILDSIEGLQCRHRHSWKSSTDGHRAPRWAVLSTAARTACVGSILTPAPTSAPAAQHSDDTSSSL